MGGGVTAAQTPFSSFHNANCRPDVQIRGREADYMLSGFYNEIHEIYAGMGHQWLGWASRSSPKYETVSSWQLAVGCSEETPAVLEVPYYVQ